MIDQGFVGDLTPGNNYFIMEVLKDFINSNKLVESVGTKVNSLSGTEEEKKEINNVISAFITDVYKVLVKYTTSQLAGFEEKQKTPESEPKETERDNDNDMLAKQMKEVVDKLKTIEETTNKSQNELKEFLNKPTNIKLSKDESKRSNDVTNSLNLGILGKKINNLIEASKLSEEKFQQIYDLNEKKKMI